jgi:protocatechuate 3,4-dioxygenase beta subunit
MTERGEGRGLRRREALGALGTLGLGGLIAACGGEGKATGGGTASAAAAASTCVLSPEVTEGPYWIDGTLTRRDIREDRAGLPLVAVFAVQDAKTCEPIAGADVEIWHCDAEGVYSGFESASQGGPAGAGGPGAGGPGGGGGPGAAGGPGGSGGSGGGGATDSERYLRGHQKTGSTGKAMFVTVFPGWYRGRTPHIHLKVHVGGDVVHTGQVFFDEKTTARVYRQAPYSSHGQPDTSHAEDGIFAQAGRSRAVLKLAGRGAGKRGYRGTITLGVAT